MCIEALSHLKTFNRKLAEHVLLHLNKSDGDVVDHDENIKENSE